MKPVQTASFAMLEAVIFAAIGMGLAFAPLTLLWAGHFSMRLDFAVVGRAVADVWLLGHGVPLRVATSGTPFTLSVAPLGFAVITAIGGWRIGVRAQLAGHPVVAAGAVTGLYVLLGMGLAAGAANPVARPTWELALVFPAVILLVGVVCGAIREWVRIGRPEGPLARWLGRLPEDLRDAARRGLRVGLAAAIGSLAAGALAVTIGFTVHFGRIIGLTQTLQAGWDGNIALLIGQLALLPNAVIWSTAWLLGPGFAFGSGTSFTAAGAIAGPVPGLPLLGLLPTEGGWLVTAGVLVPVLVAAGAGAVVAGQRRAWWQPLAAALAAGIVAAAIGALLAVASSGSVGPGRLTVVGPPVLDMALVLGCTVALGAACGGMLRRLTTRGRDRPDVDPEF